MANIAASATQFAGQALVRTASTLALNTATSYISRAFDNRVFEGPRLGDFHLQTSRDGAPMAHVFGRVRLAGQVIWASHVREISTETPVGGKGSGPSQANYSYRISFAVGLCEGVISGVDRIWANGAPLQTIGLNMRVYKGTEDQGVDPIIAATEGVNAPAFRGTAYIVFEDFPLDDFGNHLPLLNVEVVRAGAAEGKLETLVKSVNLLPGSGEFAYATTIIEESPEPGVTRPINMNNISGQADIELALDQLQAQLPNCRNVSIISTWFASSVDIGNAEIHPGLERSIRNIRNATWQVGKDDRQSAYVVSADEEGRPNFGGTPSDASLIQAIQSIKSRGMSVTLYPFILVDAAGFPWRGRMTGSANEVSGFFGAALPSDYSIGTGAAHHRNTDMGYRNFILTHANLARRAGGVDRFVIGSEMVSLTTIRDAENNFPAVTELARLAADVRQILGPHTGLTYAADWSEYFGYQPQDGSGDVYFHLDELWAHSAITAVGIDAYFPLSDWRDGAHLDAKNFETVYDLDYLSGNIEGGEGYDWYYASTADREVQIRSPINQWVYRYKDLRNWWSRSHNNNIDHVRTPTDWIPKSKPIWLTEIGCPAVKYGANQPNLFSDGKSVESNIPYNSDGSRDDFMQRRYLEAIISYWDDPNNNLVSPLTGLPMIDNSATSVWAWDARPYPDFPSRIDVWADGPNWTTGHWINGRVGTVPVREVIAEISGRVGLEDFDVSRVNGLLSGFIIDRPMRGRDALSPLINTYDLSVTESAGQVRFFSNAGLVKRAIFADEFVAQEGGEIQFSIDGDMAAIREARVSYLDASRDYQVATLSAINEAAKTVRVLDLQAPLVMDEGQARGVVETHLAKANSGRRVGQFSLARGREDALFSGALITLPETDGVWQITRLRHGLQTEVDVVQTLLSEASNFLSASEVGNVSDPIWVSEPVALAFDLPGTNGLQVGALMSPFRPTEFSAVGASVQTTSPLKLGALMTDLFHQSTMGWDIESSVEIWMPNSALFAKSDEDVLSGENRFAVETETGWEVFAAANVTLIGPQTYSLNRLLRGLQNSDDYMMQRVLAGARVIVLDAGLGTLEIPNEYIGQRLEISVATETRSGVSAEIDYVAAHLRP